MKQRKSIIFKYFIVSLLAIVLTVCLYMLHNEHEAYKKTEDTGILTLDDKADVTFNMLEQMNEDYIIGGYQIIKEQKVLMTGTSKSVETNVVIVDFPVTKLFASTNQLHTDDTAGCILSNHTMYELFGTTAKLGQQLTFGGRDYLVRGIIDTKENMVIIQYDKVTVPYTDLSLDGIIFDVSEEMYRNQTAEKFHNAYEEGDVSDSYYTHDYMSFIGRLETPIKWSDFEFWKDYGKELSNRTERKLYGDKDIIEQYHFRIFVERIKARLLLFIVCIVNFIAICILTKTQEVKKI